MDYSFVAGSLIACSGFFPENNLSLPITDKNEGLSQEQYHRVIDKVASVYRPVVADYGGRLMINRKWESPTVNAGTHRLNNLWQINLYGGMARHKDMTEDAFALVICHEIGHHIGGAPKKIISARRHWASTEGQSDYWATLKCLRRVFEKEDNENSISQSEIQLAVEENCKTALCKRISLASHAISKINAQLRRAPDPDFATPDLTRVMRTDDQHPVAQCRLDTLFQGALCPLDWKKTVSQSYEGPGTCHPKEGYRSGIRPLCWYRSTR
jgi:hypothetical protein